jgi:hypothetical protein
MRSARAFMEKHDGGVEPAASMTQGHTGWTSIQLSVDREVGGVTHRARPRIEWGEAHLHPISIAPTRDRAATRHEQIGVQDADWSVIRNENSETG